MTRFNAIKPHPPLPRKTSRDKGKAHFARKRWRTHCTIRLKDPLTKAVVAAVATAAECVSFEITQIKTSEKN